MTKTATFTRGEVIFKITSVIARPMIGSGSRSRERSRSPTGALRTSQTGRRSVPTSGSLSQLRTRLSDPACLPRPESRLVTRTSRAKGASERRCHERIRRMVTSRGPSVAAVFHGT